MGLKNGAYPFNFAKTAPKNGALPFTRNHTSDSSPEIDSKTEHCRSLVKNQLPDIQASAKGKRSIAVHFSVFFAVYRM